MSATYPSRQEAIEQLRRAIEDEGPRPEVHRATARRHRQEWPALWEAIDHLLEIEPEPYTTVSVPGLEHSCMNPSACAICLAAVRASEPAPELPPLEHVSNFTRMRLTGLQVEALFGDEDGEHHYKGDKLEVSICHKCGSIVETSIEDKHSRFHTMNSAGLGGLLG